jgi:hypothetical protein
MLGEFMGAWGAESFENDDAMDWVAELQGEGLPATGSAIQAVIELADDYLEAPICSAGLAAAEVLAALRGRPAASLPDDVLEWVRRYPGDPGAELTRNAQVAVDAILRKSELRELWEESGEFEAWQNSVGDLQARLA